MFRKLHRHQTCIVFPLSSKALNLQLENSGKALIFHSKKRWRIKLKILYKLWRHGSNTRRKKRLLRTCDPSVTSSEATSAHANFPAKESACANSENSLVGGLRASRAVERVGMSGHNAGFWEIASVCANMWSHFDVGRKMQRRNWFSSCTWVVPEHHSATGW